jgi:hypothetical protein
VLQRDRNSHSSVTEQRIDRGTRFAGIEEHLARVASSDETPNVGMVPRTYSGGGPATAGRRDPDLAKSEYASIAERPTQKR